VACWLASAGADEEVTRPWAEGGGCLQGWFTRGAALTQRARPIAPLDHQTRFTVRFRFRTVDRGTYAGLAFIGVRDQGGDFKTNAAGAMIFRHSETYGLVGNAFAADSEGALHESKDTRVSLEYGTLYEAVCTYSPEARTVSAAFFDVLTGEAVGEPDVATLPEGKAWSADRLAVWNYADGHSDNARLDLLIDSLQINDEAPLTFDDDLEELPMGDDEHFKWREAPLPELIAELTSPRDVFDEDTTFSASLPTGISGTVHFVLKTYAGEVVWNRDAAIADGVASVVLAGDEAAALEKGGRVLAATVNDAADRSAYRAVRLRGRIFRDAVGEPPDLRPGDEIVITDLSRIKPAEAVADRSAKGTWWRRVYTLPDDGEERRLVCVEEHDLEDPASCLAPPLRLDLDLEGWYEIWVRTRRHREAGGIDVRLSGEPYFFHANPLQVDQTDGGPEPAYGALVDILYRADDLAGQGLVFQQPYGTYESEHKRCNASLAGVRLVKLSDAQAARLEAERAREDTRVIGYDNDGFSYFWKWGVHDVACIARLLEPLRDQSAAFLNFELGGLGGIFIPTPYTGMYQMTGHTRDGDYRANAFYRWCFENDVNIVDVLTERAHEVGLKLFVSLMMERSFSPDATMKAHPEWRIRRGRGRWDYALPEVQDFQVKKIAWIMEHHNIDGFVADFTRYGHFFNEDEPDKFGHMNAFLRKVRAATDAVNAKKARKVALCGSLGDRSWHLTHWGTGKLDDQGLDVATWLEEGIFDLLMPEGPTALEFVAMAEDSPTVVWPRMVRGVTLDTHQGVGGEEGPKKLERGVKWAFDQGAPGIFFFNHDTWSTLGRLGFREELGLRCKTDAVYGLCEGPQQRFLTWYPDHEEKSAQRAAFKPLTVPIDAAGNVDGELIVPIRNTFPEPVEATVQWRTPSEENDAPWHIAPETASVRVAPGETGKLPFHLEGRALRQAAVPRADIELVSGAQVVFRHGLPVRAVSHMTCKKQEAPPAVADLHPRGFFALDGDGGTAAARAAVTYDDAHLHVTCDCSGMDLPQTPKAPPERDARQIYAVDRVEILLDVHGAEQEYLSFVVTPSGAQADARSYYDAFAGHFMHKRDWDAEWGAERILRDDGYTVQASIPFACLGATPEPGAAWRINILVYAYGLGDEPQRCSWSSPDKDARKPASFGTVRFR